MANFVLNGQNDATGTSTSPAVTLSVTSGELLVFLCVTRNGAGTHDSVTDSQTQTWTQIGTPVSATGYASIWYCQNMYTGSLTVTGTLSGSDVWYVNLSKWANPHATPYVSTDTATNTATTNHVHGNTGLNATVGQLLIGVAIQASTVSDEAYTSSLFTPLQFTNSTNIRQWWGYRIATGTESLVQGAWTQTSGSSAGRIALFDHTTNDVINAKLVKTWVA